MDDKKKDVWKERTMEEKGKGCQMEVKWKGGNRWDFLYMVAAG